MIPENIRSALADEPFFQGLTDAQLDRLSEVALVRAFVPGEMVVHAGDLAGHFHLLRNGRMAIEMHTPHRGLTTIQTVHPGEIVGWSWLVPPYEWHFDVRALEASRTIEFDAAQVRGACASDAEFGYQLLNRFAPLMVERLQATQMLLLDMYDVRT